MTCFKVLSVHNVRVVVAITLLFWAIFNFIWSFLYLKIYSEGIGSHILLKVMCILVGMAVVTIVLSNVLSLQCFLIINIAFTAVVTGGALVVKQRFFHEFLSSTALASGLIVHALLLNLTPRYYAINIRATLFGCCHASGYFGAMISYILFIYKAMDDITFVAVELGLSIVLVILSFALPHVDGRELPDVMEDMEYFAELSKPLRWATQKRSSASREEIEMRIYSFGTFPSASADQSTVTNHRVFKTGGPWQKLIAYIQKKFKSESPTRNAGHHVDHSPKDHTLSQGTRVSTITNWSQEEITNTSTVASINDASDNFHYRRFSREYFHKTKFSSMT